MYSIKSITRNTLLILFSIFVIFSLTQKISVEAKQVVKYEDKKYTVPIFKGVNEKTPFDDYDVPVTLTNTATGESKKFNSKYGFSNYTKANYSEVTFSFDKPGVYVATIDSEDIPGYKVSTPVSRLITITVEETDETLENGIKLLKVSDVVSHLYFRLVEGDQPETSLDPLKGAKRTFGVRDLTRPTANGGFESFEGRYEIPYTITNLETGKVENFVTSFIHGGGLTVVLADGDYEIKTEDNIPGYKLVEPSTNGTMTVKVVNGKYTKVSPTGYFAFDVDTKDYESKNYTVPIFKGINEKTPFNDYDVPVTLTNTTTGESKKFNSKYGFSNVTNQNYSEVTFSFDKPGVYVATIGSEDIPGYKVSVPVSRSITIIVKETGEITEEGKELLSVADVVPYLYFRLIEGEQPETSLKPLLGSKHTFGVKDLSKPTENGGFESFEGRYEIPYTITNLGTGEVEYRVTSFIHGGGLTVVLADGDYEIKMEDNVPGYKLVEPYTNGTMTVKVVNGEYVQASPTGYFAFNIKRPR